MKNLQAEHAQWLASEFPNQRLELPAALMVEEAAELLHCVSQLEQIAQFGPHPRYTAVQLREELFDAVGDCAIACCSYCNTKGEDFAEICSVHPSASKWQSKTKQATYVASTAACVVCIDRGDSAKELLKSFMVAVKTVAEQHAIDFDIAVKATWEVVKQRRRKPDAPVCPRCYKQGNLMPVTPRLFDVGVAYSCQLCGPSGLRYDSMLPLDRSCLCLS